ncbi:MAG: thiamine pyrophosphate-binding protein [Alphaproteobacteria bacterium]|nr:thiamine pyrophosphate-binding protein [Alphaproteobacteria bacterium]
MPKQSGARHLVDALVALGADTVFCVPGESYLAVLDALFDVSDRIRVVTCRNEAGAANMAEAYGKLTGRPGICMVTRGPGATHASVGVHTARQDSTPMILFIGQVARADRSREAFQEVDYRAFFGPIAKWADEIDDPARTGEFVRRAFRVAMQGRPGPVALALPEDMLTEEVEAPAISTGATARRGAADPHAVDDLVARLSNARRPLIVAGGGWSADGRASLARLAAKADLPVALSFRRKDALDNDDPQYVGDLGLGPNPALIAAVREADLIIALGARLGENPTQGYTLFDPAETAAKLVHIHPDPDELGKVWPAALAIPADANLAAAQLAAAVAGSPPDRGAWRAQLRAAYEAWSAPIEVSGAVNLSQCFAHMSAALPADAIVCNGAGNYAAWLHRFFRHRAGGRQLAPTSGAMGYGVPAAIAAKIIAPERTVVAVAGDGCFLMTGQELATAVQHDAAIIVIVVDNGSYGTIRMHQERSYPQRTVATDLVNPDFVEFAHAFGFWAALVEHTEDFPEALAQARACGRPALLHVRVSVNDISPGRTLASLRPA